MRSIAAPVGLAGRNTVPDTLTVQELLNQARAKAGSQSIAVDGLVGPETVGAIQTFQLSQFGWADGRVDPDGPTIKALNASDAPASGRVRCGAADLGGGAVGSPGGVRFGLVGASTPTAAATPKDTALTHKTEALAWLTAALAALQTVRTLMQTGLTADLQKLDSMLEFQALKTHFHIDRHSDPLKFLSALGKTYTLMNIAVTGAATNFENDLSSDDFANADPGGFHSRNDKQNPGRMYFCQKYISTGPLTRVVTILHESAHYVDKAIDHFASAVPAPNGRALTGSNGQSHSHNYAQMTPDEAQQNAASYAGFAINVAKRQDTRPTVTQ